MTARSASAALAFALCSLLLIGTTATAQRRDDRNSDGGTPATARPSSPSPSPAPAPAPAAAPKTETTPTEGRSPRSDATASSGKDSQPNGDTGARRRDGHGAPGDVAVPRDSGSGRGQGGGQVIIVPGGYGFYPWGYAGLGFGGYYGGYYDPLYGYGGYPSYSVPSRSRDEGAIRLKVKPREASVYVDGYFVGHVDDFDGALQKLHVSPGPHRIEIRDPKFESLTFDVRIESDQTITYRGEMQPAQ